jgi:hypothetical protein
MASDNKRLSGIIEKLVEHDDDRTWMMDNLISRVQKLEDQLNTPGDGVDDGHLTKRSGVLKGGSNDHPSLKVRDSVILCARLKHTVSLACCTRSLL